MLEAHHGGRQSGAAGSFAAAGSGIGGMISAFCVSARSIAFAFPCEGSHAHSFLGRKATLPRKGKLNIHYQEARWNREESITSIETLLTIRTDTRNVALSFCLNSLTHRTSSEHDAGSGFILPMILITHRRTMDHGLLLWPLLTILAIRQEMELLLPPLIPTRNGSQQLLEWMVQ